MARRTSRSARPAPALTADDVVEAALALLDDVGLAGFTMRALAARLHTYPATLYWHVGNRREILDRVYQRVLAEMVVPAPGALRWDRWLAQVAREYRRSLHRHPNAAMLALYPLSTDTDFVEVILAVLERAGFRGRALTDAFNTFTGSVTGWVAVELSAAAGEADAGWRVELETRVRELPAGRYPTITSNLRGLADEVFTLRWHGGAEKPMDRSFDAALEAWLDGLRGLRRGRGERIVRS